MIRKVSATVAAGALMASAPAMADEPNTTDPVNFNAEVKVQQIAELEVEDATASMVVDNPQDSFQSQPETGSQFNASDGNLAVLKLRTNFQVDAVEIDFETESGFGPPDSDVTNAQFGVAKNEEGEKLGVFPQAGVLKDNGDIIGSSNGIFLHRGKDEPLQVTGKTRQDDSGFGPGVHRIGVGVSTSWNRDKVSSETEFAEPGTYTIGMTASIVPKL
jgi:hypothetical protein